MSTAPKTAEAACMERERRYCRRERLAGVSLIAYRTGMQLSSFVWWSAIDIKMSTFLLYSMGGRFSTDFFIFGKFF